MAGDEERRHKMSTFMFFWANWAGLFSMLPYGDPYVAAFGAVLISVVIGKRIKTAMRLV